MKLSKSQAGFTAVHMLLILVLLGIIGFTGWKVYDAGKSAKPAESSTATPAVKKEESKIPDGFVEYENKELGFKFAYPKDWGEVKVDKVDNKNNETPDTKGMVYRFSFSARQSTLSQGSNGYSPELDITAIATDAVLPATGFNESYARGFTEKDGKVFGLSDRSGEDKGDTIFARIGKGKEGVLIKHTTLPSGAEADNYYASFNLKKNYENVKGIRFWYVARNNSRMTYEDFQKVIGSFEITN